MILHIIQVAAIVVFTLVGVLLALLVLIQDDQGDSIGGLFSGGSGSAFGSRSGNILTTTTSILGALFIVFAIFLAFWFRTPAGGGPLETQISTEAPPDWFSSELVETSPLDDITEPVTAEPTAEGSLPTQEAPELPPEGSP